jgi:undecaprenyl-diphosphatase
MRIAADDIFGAVRLRPSLRDALALGVVQGPTELLPVSSSVHVALLASLLAGDAEVDPSLQDSLEVALHAGAAAALLIAGRSELMRTVHELNRSRLAAGALALTPPALVGYLLEGRPGGRPSGRRTTVAGLVVGGVAMALADRTPQARTLVQAGARDGLALGVAQAVSLLPGVSRNGATLAVARARGFAREDAQALSWRVGLPVIAGAAALETRRLTERGAPAGATWTLAAGAGAAFLSTLASAPLLRPGRRGRGLLPFALYRLALALVVNRLCTAHNRGR